MNTKNLFFITMVVWIFQAESDSSSESEPATESEDNLAPSKNDTEVVAIPKYEIKLFTDALLEGCSLNVIVYGTKGTLEGELSDGVPNSGEIPYRTYTLDGESNIGAIKMFSIKDNKCKQSRTKKTRIYNDTTW